MTKWGGVPRTPSRRPVLRRGPDLGVSHTWSSIVSNESSGFVLSACALMATKRTPRTLYRTAMAPRLAGGAIETVVAVEEGDPRAAAREVGQCVCLAIRSRKFEFVIGFLCGGEKGTKSLLVVMCRASACMRTIISEESSNKMRNKRGG